MLAGEAFDPRDVFGATIIGRSYASDGTKHEIHRVHLQHRLYITSLLLCFVCGALAHN